MNSPGEQTIMGIFLRAVSLILVGLLAYAVFGIYDLGNAAQQSWMDQHVRQQGLQGVAVYVGLVALLTALGVPRQVLSFLGGYVFDVLYGTLWATLGTGIACVLSFSYARFLGQKALQGRWSAKLAPCNDFLCQSPFLLTMVVRIVPLGSNFLTNLAAGVSTIPALPFLTGSVAGFTVQNLIFALMGSGLRLDTPTHTLLSICLYLFSLALGFWIFYRFKTSRTKLKAF